MEPVSLARRQLYPDGLKAKWCALPFGFGVSSGSQGVDSGEGNIVTESPEGGRMKLGGKNNGSIIGL